MGSEMCIRDSNLRRRSRSVRQNNKNKELARASVLTCMCVCQSQATHTRLRDEINRSRESAPHGQTVQHARTRSQLVALRASLMEAHINGMLLAADGASQPS